MASICDREHRNFEITRLISITRIGDGSYIFFIQTASECGQLVEVSTSTEG